MNRFLDPTPRRATVEPEGLAGEVGTTRMLEAGLAALLVVDGVPIPGLGFPFSLLGVAGLSLLGFTRRPVLQFGRTNWVLWAFGLLLVYISVVSYVTPDSYYAADWTRRIIRIAAVLALVIMLAEGRLHLPSILKGLMLALFVNAAAFYAGITPDAYGGALTGWLGDKNKAGLTYAAVGVLVLSQARSRWGQAFLVLTSLGFIWLSGSRTSITAYAFGVLWLALVATRPAWVRWLAAGGIVLTLPWIEENFAQAGDFANRWGSDLLRGRIDAAVADKLAVTPPQGLGLGEAYVVIDQRTWYFHNSFDTLQVEGGWLWLVGIVAITVFFGLRPFSATDRGLQSRYAQAATVVVLICAWKLGEVMLTNVWGLALGIALNQVLREKSDLPAGAAGAYLPRLSAALDRLT